MKLSGMVVLSFCIMVAAIIAAVGYANYDPTMKEVVSWKKYRDDLMQEYKKKDQAIKREKDAEKMAKATVDQWQAIAATRTLPDSLEQGGIDLSMNEYQLAIVIPTFRNSVQKAVNAQVKQGGVKVISGPAVPMPPTDPTKILLSYFNYPALPPVVIFDLGTVTVEGTFQQISDNMKAWSFMPHYLAVADGLRLTGTSPKLTGTYSVSIVGFLQTDPKRPIFPAVPPGGKLVTAPIGVPGATPAAGGAAPAGGGAAAAKPAPGTPAAGKPAVGAPAGAGAARVPVRGKNP